jgi:tetratricopeptide (TPR) repeat protein
MIALKSGMRSPLQMVGIKKTRFLQISLDGPRNFTREIQMPPETWSAKSGFDSAGDPPRGGSSAETGVFRKEGEYWTIGYAGKSFRLRDTKGLGYIAHLLRHPTVEFHVLDLTGGIGGRRDDDETQSLPRGNEDLEKSGMHVTNLGDAGEMLDTQAKAEYRRRLSQLREELDEAKDAGNVDRAEQAEQEIEALTSELSRAVGLGGRDRRAASASERARQSISKTKKSVIERIAQSDSALAEILSRSIKTGTFCSYQPDSPIAWEFGETIAEPQQPPNQEAPRPDADPAPPRAKGQQSRPMVLEVSPFSLAERTAFVGRESESSSIRAAIDRALGGHGSFVMLWDGPGVGKTRLAMEMAEYASSVGFRCSVGHCYEREEPFPYLPIVEIIEYNVARAASLDDYRRRMGNTLAELSRIAPSLRRIFPDLPTPIELPASQQRGFIFQSVSEALARSARLRPQMLVLEDLHWADETTLALLIYLANRIAQLPAVIVGTYRSGYSQQNPALVRTLEELIRKGVRPQKLGGLSKDAVAQMLHELSQREVPQNLLSLIYEESQGYPFFVEEVYRHLLEDGKVFDDAGEFRADIQISEIDVPENVRLIISRRLERLEENETRALAAAAVIGRSFSFQLLNALSQIDVDELFTVIEKAERMGIIIPSSEGPERPFMFNHELVRQTLLARTSGPRQMQLHASVADAIEQLYPHAVRERAGEIANHLIKAGSFADEQKLVRILTMAGNSALDAAAFEEAQQSFQSALSHRAAISAKERADLLARLAIAESGLDQWDTAFANLRESLEIHIGTGDREMIGHSFSELTDALIVAGRFQDGAATARRGLEYLEGDVSADRVRLLDGLSQALAWAEGYEPAHQALEQAIELASQLADPTLLSRVVGVRSIINFHFFRLREAVADGFLCEEMGGTDAPLWQRAVQLRALYPALAYLGRTEQAARVANELEAFARKTGQSFPIALRQSEKAWAEFYEAPDLARLETRLQEAFNSQQHAQFAFWIVSTESQFSIVDFYRGNWGAALSHAEAACNAEPGSSSEGVATGTLFRHLAYNGDRTRALSILNEKRSWMPRLGQKNPRGSWSMLTSVIEGLTMLGERSQAADLYPLSRELLDTGAVALWPISRLTQTIAGIAATAANEWDSAENHFQTAMLQARSSPNHLEQAEINRFQAMMLLDRATPNDQEKAQPLLKEAQKTYKQIGMPRHIDLTRTLLNRSNNR